MISFLKQVKCPHCGEKNSVDLSDYVTDESTYEREMGEEVEYSIEGCTVKCKECSEEFEVSGSIWEYPEGDENCNTLTTE